MSLKVTNLELGNEFNQFKPDWLRHNPMEKIPFVLEFEISTAVKLWSGNALEYAPSEFITADYIQSELDIFQEFYVGDTIKIADGDQPGNNGTYTIIEKPNDNTIRLNDTFSNSTSEDCIIEVRDIPDKIKYNWNFIENNESLTFESKVDGNKIEARGEELDASNTTPVAMEFKGEKSWQIGNLNIEGVEIETSPVYKSKFKITGNLYLNPFFLPDQWDDITSDPRVAPQYFKDFNALKFVHRIEASYEGRNPQFAQVFEDSETLGQSGWYNEEFDLTESNFFVDSYSFEISGNPIEELKVTQSDIDFEIVVKNTEDAPFTNDSKFTVNFCIAPETQEEIENNGQTMDYNFRFDRMVNIVGDSAVNGDQFGVANRQVLKQVSATLNSSSQITITGKIDFDSALYDYLLTLDNPRYLLTVGVGTGDDGESSKLFQDDNTFTFQDGNNYVFQDALEIVESNDKRAVLIVDVNDFEIELATDDFLTADDTLFIEHPFNDIGSGTTTLEAFPEDEVVYYKRIKVDLAETSFDVSLKKIRCGVRAKNGSLSFDVDELTQEFPGATVVNDIEFVDTSALRPFKAPLTELIKSFTVERDIDADSGDLRFYDIKFPFLCGWEYWQANSNVNAAFFDTAEENNGLNDEWVRFDALTGWNMYCFAEVTFEINGEEYTKTFEDQFTLNDYQSNPDWDNEVCKSYDINDVELGFAGIKYLQAYSKTKITADFEYVGAGSVDIDNLAMIFRIEPFENGGRSVSTRISSERDSGAESQFYYVDSKQITITNPSGNIYRGTAYVNNEKLQNFSQFSITARIYDKSLIVPVGIGAMIIEDTFIID